MTSSLNLDHRYLRINYLINEKVPSLLRQRFLELWKENEKEVWQNCSAFGEKFTNGIGKFVYNKSQKIQKQNLSEGNISTWDLPLLLDAILALQQDPPRMKKSISRGDAETLKNVRNKLAHLGTVELKEETFEEFWSSISGIVIKHGMDIKELENIKKNKLLQSEDSSGEKENSPNILEARDLKEKGNQYYLQRNYKEACNLYSKAIQVPSLPAEELAVLYSNRSAVFIELNQLVEAKEDAKVANTLKPRWSKPYHRLGKIYELRRKFRDALFNYDLALCYDPDLRGAKEGKAACTNEIAREEREEHLDPLALPISEYDINQLVLEKGMSLPFKDKFSKEMFLQGHPHFICTEAHKYFYGHAGYKQDYEMAARLFGKAAAKGNAEGIYNLARQTMDGKGVKRNPSQAYQLLLKAASMENMIAFPPGSSNVTRAAGVNEAQHNLGLLHENGVVVEVNFREAEKWYLKALENGCSFSANNLGLLYRKGKLGFNFVKSNQYFKVGSLLGCVRAMENIAFNFLEVRDIEQAAKYMSLAKASGSSHMQVETFLRREEAKTIYESFCEDEFRSELEKELMAGPMKKYIENKELLKTIQGYKEIKNTFKGALPDVKELVIEQRALFKNARNRRGQGIILIHSTATPKCCPTPSSLTGLKDIFFLDFDPKVEDKVYQGFVIQLTVVEDAYFGRPSIPLIVQDDKGTVGRAFIYNYPQKKETHDEIGFGCVFSIINPYYRLMTDGKFAIRVDDPGLLFKYPNLKKDKMCRFCRTVGELLAQCRKCRRAQYCSKECLKKDEDELQHNLVCFKKL